MTFGKLWLDLCEEVVQHVGSVRKPGYSKMTYLGFVRPAPSMSTESALSLFEHESWEPYAFKKCCKNRKKPEALEAGPHGMYALNHKPKTNK